MQIRFAALLFTCLFAGLFALATDRPVDAATTLPTKMNFQGRITNSAGSTLANGTYNMRFRIFNAATGGAQQWSEDRLVSATQGVTVTNGQFSVQLGSVTSLPASVFASNSLYFEIELPTPTSATSNSPVWTEGAMTPRNQLATSAYAFNSETLDGLDSAAFGQLDQNNVFTGNNTFSGTLQGGSSLALGTTSVAGSLVISDGSSNTGTIAMAPTAGNYTYTIPVTTANDTFCLQTLANCSAGGGVSTIGALDGGTANANGAAIVGSTLYLQSASTSNAGLVNTTAQSFAGNKTFTGTVAAAGLQSTSLDRADAGVLTIGAANASTISLAQNSSTLNLDSSVAATKMHGATITTVESQGNTGGDISSELDANGFAHIAYLNMTNGDVMYTRCTDATCVTKNTTAVAYVSDSPNLIIEGIDLALGSDGFARITYYDEINGDLGFIRCTNADCTTKTTTTVDATLMGSPYSGLSMAADGFARISYYSNATGDLKFIRCTNADCTTKTTTTVDSADTVGHQTSIAIAADGFARISYADLTNYDLKYTRCTNADCTTKTTTAVDTEGNVGFESSIAIAADGFARIGYLDATNQDLKFARCTDADCTTKTTTAIDSAVANGAGSIAIAADGFARISYYDQSNSDLKFARCTNADCTTKTTTAVDTAGSVGSQSSIAIAADGFARIAYSNQSDDDLKYARLLTVDGRQVTTGGSLGAAAAYDKMFVQDVQANGSLSVVNSGGSNAALDIASEYYIKAYDPQSRARFDVNRSSFTYQTSDTNTGFYINPGGISIGQYSDTVVGQGSAALAIDKYGTGDGLFVNKGAGEAGLLARFTSDWNVDVMTLGTDGAARFRSETNTANAFSVQDSSGVNVLNIDTTNNSLAVGGDLSLAAEKSLTISGGATGTRPSAPTEGMVYFDSTTKKLLVYSNGKWQADRTDAVLVAASNSSQADKDAADYVTDGNTVAANDGDQVQINNALTAAAGKKIVLLAGTYVADATILVPNNTSFAGVGTGTVVELADIDVNDRLIENLDNLTGAGVTVRDMKLDGRKDLNDSVGIFQSGIYLEGVGGGSGTSVRAGPHINNVVANNFNGDGFSLSNLSGARINGNSVAGSTTAISLYGIVENTVISGNVFLDNEQLALYIDNAKKLTFTQNVARGGGTGLYADAISQSIITGNTINDLSVTGIMFYSAVENTISGNNIKNVYAGIELTSSSGNVIDGNVIKDTTYAGVNLSGGVHRNTVTANQITNSGGSAANDAIIISNSDSNIVTNNAITDASATTTNYAISITNSTSDTNYLANNMLGGGSINNLGTGTIYAGQVDASGNYTVQPAANINLNKDTLVSSGSLTLGTSSVAGGLKISDGSSNIATLAIAPTAGNYTYTIPVTTANDTFCLSTLANCAMAMGALDGGTANATGASVVGSTLYLQSASASFAGLVSTTTQSFAGNKTFTGNVTVSGATTLSDNVTVAANKTIQFVGGATGTRPVSPGEGAVYYDQTTKQLLTYTGSRWQADGSDAIMVAASNSSQADKDAADYVADGNTATAADGDQVQINQALTAGSGKKVVLLAGTYTADATILVPNNTTFAGVGRGTIVELADIDVTDNLIENGDASAGTGVTVQDMQIDGRKDLNTAGTQNGIYLYQMGSGTGATARQGGTVRGVLAKNFSQYGIQVSTSNNNVLTGNTVIANNSNGIFLHSGSNNVASNNNVQGNATGIALTIQSNSTVSGNTVQGNTSQGISIFTSDHNTVTGNTLESNPTGFYVSSAASNNLTGNTVKTSTSNAFSLSLNANLTVISGNRITDSGGAATNNAINIANSDNVSVTGNIITDSSATTNNYAINISVSSSDATYLADNTLGTGTINDLGTGTVYASQVDGSGNLTIQPAANINLNKNTLISSGSLTLGNATTAGGLVISDGSSNTATIAVGNLAGNYTYTIPVTTANDTFCLVTLANCAAAGSGVTTVGALDGGTANANGATITGTTIFLQSASATNAGLISTGAQTFAGNKTFNGTLTVANTASFTGQLTIGTADTTGTLLVLDTKTDAGDPAGQNGAMYYNSNLKRFRCYQDNAWVDCTTGDGIAKKTADQAATVNSTTFQNITDMTFAIGASETYTFDAILPFNISNANADMKYTITVPTGAVVTAQTTASSAATTVVNCAITTSGQTCAVPVTAAFNGVVTIRGTVTNSTTAGTFNVQFAQNTANASAGPTASKGATLRYTRL